MKLNEQLPMIVSLFRARLASIDMIQNEDCVELLENLVNCVRYPPNPKVAWLCFRVVDQTIKRLFLKKMSDQFMPLNFSAITEIKVKPSASLLSIHPFSHFETNQ